jgi:CBS domain-containing protein
LITESREKEINAIVSSIGFLAVGIFVVYVMKTYLALEGDNLFVSLLLIPVVIYLVLSGRLSELKAGGFSMVFNQALKEKVMLSPSSVELPIDPLEAVAKGGYSPLQETMRRLSRLKDVKPVTLTLNLGRGYVDEAILFYISSLSQLPSFRFVVLLDEMNKVVGYFPVNAFLQIIQNDDIAGRFISNIRNADLEELNQFPGIITETVSPSASNIEALEILQKGDYDALLVVDDNRNLRGVVQRDKIIGNMLLSMASPAR